MVLDMEISPVVCRIQVRLEAYFPRNRHTCVDATRSFRVCCNSWSVVPPDTADDDGCVDGDGDEEHDDSDDPRAPRLCEREPEMNKTTSGFLSSLTDSASLWCRCSCDACSSQVYFLQVISTSVRLCTPFSELVV